MSTKNQELWIRFISNGIAWTMKGREPETVIDLTGLTEETLNTYADRRVFGIESVVNELPAHQFPQRADMDERWIRLAKPEQLYKWMREALDVDRRNRNNKGRHPFVKDRARVHAARRELQHAITLMKLGATGNDTIEGTTAAFMERVATTPFELASGAVLDRICESFGIKRCAGEGDVNLRERVKEFRRAQVMPGHARIEELPQFIIIGKMDITFDMNNDKPIGWATRSMGEMRFRGSYQGSTHDVMVSQSLTITDATGLMKYVCITKKVTAHWHQTLGVEFELTLDIHAASRA